MSSTLSEAIKEDWLECCSAGMTWCRYAKTNMNVLALWCNKTDLEQTIASKKDFTAVSQQVKRLVQSCPPLQSMLASAWDQVSRSCWKVDILSKIKDLEHQDYDAQGMKSFRDCMTMAAVHLMAKGKKDKYKKSEVEFSFGGKDFKMDIGSASEEWQLHLDKRLQECALQAGSIQLLPWEELFWSKGSFPDVPEHCKVPDEHIDRMKSAREFALEHVDSSMTVQTMLRVLKSKEKLCSSYSRDSP